MASGSKLPATIQAGVATARRRRETGTGARARLGEDSQEEENLDSQEEEEVEQVRQEQEGVGDWEAENPGLLGANIPEYTPPMYTYEQEVLMEDCNTALDWYQLFSPLEWLDYVTEQTRSYAISRGRNNKLASLTKENIR